MARQLGEVRVWTRAFDAPTFCTQRIPLMSFRLLAAGLVVALLAGCASTPPQQPLPVSQDLLSNKSTRIAVVMTPMPKVDTQFPGAGCLLCLAAASMTNSSLTSYVQTLSAEDLGHLPAEITKALRAKGLEATQITEPLDVSKLSNADKAQLNFATKNFTPLKSKFNADKLLVIEVQAVGVWRNYANYFPSGDPRAVVRGRGYIVDLTTNALDWFAPIDVARSADTKWDEAPNFPGLTNAYYQAIEEGRDTFKQPFLR
jgi:hypothetical protein